MTAFHSKGLVHKQAGNKVAQVGLDLVFRTCLRHIKYSFDLFNQHEVSTYIT